MREVYAVAKTKNGPMDKLFSEYIRRRAIARVGGCEKCLTPKYNTTKDNGDPYPAFQYLQCSHFIGRSNHCMRWDEDNAMGLCGACHMLLSGHPTEHVKWYTAKVGQAVVDNLYARQRQRERPDLNALTIYYRHKIKELQDLQTKCWGF